MAHLAVEETVFEPMAAAYACIRPDGRARGAALVDFGLHSTDLVVYDGDALLLAASIPVWADHMTRDIATLLKVTYEDAECLKHEYGCALLGLTSDSTLIEVPSPEGRPSREARRSELIEILEARAEEVFLYVRSELQRVGMEDAVRRHPAFRRRRASARHVRYGGAHFELPGGQSAWHGRRHRRLAGGIENAPVDHGRRPGDVFGEAETPSAAPASRRRAHGPGLEMSFEVRSILK